MVHLSPTMINNIIPNESQLNKHPMKENLISVALDYVTVHMITVK